MPNARFDNLVFNAVPLRFNPDLPNIIADFNEVEKKQNAEKNGPELWDKILEGVREIYDPQYACVAGGAVRDYLLGIKPKDIDVWCIQKEGEYRMNELLEQADCLGWKYVEINHNALRYGDQQNVFVLRGQVFGCTAELIFPIRGKMIEFPTGRNVVEGFDFYICQHWYDGQVNSTPEAKTDLLKKRWRVVKEKKLDAVLRNHFERVNKRCKGIFTLDEGDPWYKEFAGKVKLK
jgi:hypothetical protein